MFYTAYFRSDVKDASTRPVTFIYNGGPGSASLWLHMGSVGPVRVVTSSPEATAGPPFRWVPNEYSLLDVRVLSKECAASSAAVSCPWSSTLPSIEGMAPHLCLLTVSHDLCWELSVIPC